MIGVAKLTLGEKRALLKWGMRMFSLGQHSVGEIQEVKYGGRLIVLDDDSRWEVDEFDAITSELWDVFEKVAIIDDEMYLLNESE